MGLKKFLKRVFSSKSRDKEKYLYTKVIFNIESEFMILISFSDHYHNQMMEFLDICSWTSGVTTKLIQSSYDEETDNGELIIHNRNYLLIDMDDYSYAEILYHSNMSNPIISAISEDVKNIRHIEKYKDVLLFDEPDNITFDKCIKITDYKLPYKVTDIDKILKSLPNCFTGYTLLSFIHIYFPFTTPISLYDYLLEVYEYKSDEEAIDYFESVRKNILSKLVKHPTDAVLRNYIGPQYLVMEDEDIPGDLDEESLADIFKQTYDRFNAISDDNIMYKDIDEIEILEGDDNNE